MPNMNDERSARQVTDGPGDVRMVKTTKVFFYSPATVVWRRSLVRSSARPQGLVSIPDAGFDRRNAFSYSRHLELRRIRKSGLTGDHDTIKNSDDLARIPSPKIRLTMLGYNHSLPCEMGSIILTEISTPVPERTQSNHNNANARKRIISFQLHMKKIE